MNTRETKTLWAMNVRGPDDIVAAPDRETELKPHEPFEVFSDAAYFDMWALRPKGQTDFNLTLHFSKRHDAVRASYVIAEWSRRAQ